MPILTMKRIHEQDKYLHHSVEMDDDDNLKERQKLWQRRDAFNILKSSSLINHLIFFAATVVLRNLLYLECYFIPRENVIINFTAK
jgi:hypothetical protein